MRTPINNDNIKDLFIFKDQADVELFKDGFFEIDNLKYMGRSETIRIIRCREAFKLYTLIPSRRHHNSDKKLLGYDFCFDDDLPIFKPEVKKVI